MEMLRGVQDLKQGQPSTVPDFFGFNNWKEIVEFAKSGEGEHLLTFVNLVESRSERQLMWALSRTVDDDKCDLTISTAHKAKGREWQTVRLMDDFLKSQPREQQQSRIQGRIGHDASELRLFYVALTRAREAIEVPSNILDMIGVKNVGASPSNSASATHSNSARTAPLAPARGERPRTSFVAPTNWQPRTPPVAPRPVDASPVTPRPSISAKLSLPPRKGFWNWLTGG